MGRARITMTTVHEYDMKPESYPNCTTDEERLAMDIEGYDDDPGLLITDDTAHTTVKGELIS